MVDPINPVSIIPSSSNEVDPKFNKKDEITHELGLKGLRQKKIWDVDRHLDNLKAFLYTLFGKKYHTERDRTKILNAEKIIDAYKKTFNPKILEPLNAIKGKRVYGQIRNKLLDVNPSIRMMIQEVENAISKKMTISEMVRHISYLKPVNISVLEESVIEKVKLELKIISREQPLNEYLKEIDAKLDELEYSQDVKNAYFSDEMKNWMDKFVDEQNAIFKHLKTLGSNKKAIYDRINAEKIKLDETYSLFKFYLGNSQKNIYQEVLSKLTDRQKSL